MTADHSSHTSHRRHATRQTSTNTKINLSYVTLGQWNQERPATRIRPADLHQTQHLGRGTYASSSSAASPPGTTKDALTFLGGVTLANIVIHLGIN